MGIQGTSDYVLSTVLRIMLRVEVLYMKREMVRRVVALRSIFRMVFSNFSLLWGFVRDCRGH